MGSESEFLWFSNGHILLCLHLLAVVVVVVVIVSSIYIRIYLQTKYINFCIRLISSNQIYSYLYLVDIFKPNLFLFIRFLFLSRIYSYSYLVLFLNWIYLYSYSVFIFEPNIFVFVFGLYFSTKYIRIRCWKYYLITSDLTYLLMKAVISWRSDIASSDNTAKGPVVIDHLLPTHL